MDRSRSSRRRFLTLAGGLAAAGAGCSTLVEEPTTESEEGESQEDDGADGTPEVVESTDGDAGADGSRYRRLYEATVGSVVSIQHDGGDGGMGAGGSGFVVGDLIVTNDHVVPEVEQVEVRFAEGEWTTATVLGGDVGSDLALCEPDALPEYADSLGFAEEPAPVGTEVAALGNPFGLQGSISTGVVSGVERSLPAPTGFPIPDAVQTTAPVNPGNSGGPLVDLDGAVVGVISAGGGDAIGFAISAALARRVVPALAEDGDYVHPYVGIEMVTVSPRIARANGLEDTGGVYVAGTVDGSPAAGALSGSDDTTDVDGQPVPVGGDVIVGIDGEAILDSESLSRYLAIETSPGDEITVEVLRGGSEESVTVTLEARPEPDQAEESAEPPGQ
ncbi:S1C family serine protease [Natronorarus salvus]|uniref:S1C family serine protease n=1 Tax=Natronorarus salvus TaxID=3117733 RepID=UPI002F2690CB